MSRDKACQRYLQLAIHHYAVSLQLEVKHVYQALPRLLSLWFDFTAITFDFTVTSTNERRGATKGWQVSTNEMLSGGSVVSVSCDFESITLLLTRFLSYRYRFFGAIQIRIEPIYRA